MFAEKTELNLVADLNENALVELNAAEIEDVSGGVLPIVAWWAGLSLASKLGIAGGAGFVGFGAAGYLINR